jgi:hypothetical protein
MSSDTSIWIEYRSEQGWQYVKQYHLSYNNLPAVLARIVESKGRPFGGVLSQAEMLDRLPEDVSSEVRTAAQKLEPYPGSIFIEVGWLWLSELVLFDWNTVWRTYPLYQDTYADAIGEYFLNEIVGKLLEEYRDPDRIRMIYWTTV